jgi:hypothetical protein
MFRAERQGHDQEGIRRQQEEGTFQAQTQTNSPLTADHEPWSRAAMNPV